jgi:hypothetical protein
MQVVNFAELQAQWGNAPYRELVQKHLRETGPRLELVMQGILDGLTETEQKVLGEVLAFCSLKSQWPGFWWNAKAWDMLQAVKKHFGQVMAEAKAEPEDKVAFAMFQYVTLTWAGAARESKDFRKSAGIRKGFFSA